MKFFGNTFTLLLFITFSLVSNSQSVSIHTDYADVIDTISPIWNGIGGSTGLAMTPQGERLFQRIFDSSPYPYYKRIWGVTETGTAVPFTAEADGVQQTFTRLIRMAILFTTSPYLIRFWTLFGRKNLFPLCTLVACPTL